MGELLPKWLAEQRIRRRPEVVLLVNVRSRRGVRYGRSVRPMLEGHGFTVTAEHLVSDPAAQLPALLPEILAARPPLLVVGSGDGTIATVVDHLAHTTPPGGCRRISSTSQTAAAPAGARRPVGPAPSSRRVIAAYTGDRLDALNGVPVTQACRPYRRRGAIG